MSDTTGTPAQDPHDRPARLAETHLSWVMLTPTRAYKLLKPVRMPFLDLTTSTARVAAAARELELNRRIAPNVYLGTSDIVENGEVVDSLIVMRRLADDERLPALLGHAAFPDCLRDVVRTIAAFHSRAEPVDPAPSWNQDAMRANWAGNFEVIARHAGTVIDTEEYGQVSALVRSYLHNRHGLFEQRIHDGFVRDGHGDLIAEDIFCTDDGPQIIDCLAFNDEWRITDVLADIGFLAMDIHRLAGPDTAQQVLDWYREFTSEPYPSSLAHHYIAYRAHVRAKVALLRYEQGDEASAELARTYHRLARHHLEAGRIRLIVVGGGAGVGKSTVARALGEHYAYPVLVTDEVRKDLTATERSEHRFADPGAGIYDTATTDATYAEVFREAELLLQAGEAVVLDASWTEARHRDQARQLAWRYGAELVEIECVLEPAIAKERIARRLADIWNPSDATPEVVDYQAARRDPWPNALALETFRPPAQVIDDIVARIEALAPTVN